MSLIKAVSQMREEIENCARKKIRDIHVGLT